MKPKCEDCRYWDRYTGQFDGEGDCKRNAPFPVMRDDGYTTNYETHWPCTSRGDWCGEFKPKEIKQ